MSDSAALALITGATSKLGRVLVTQLVQAGWTVIAHYYQNQTAATSFASLAPGRVIPLQGDLSCTAGISTFIGRLREVAAGGLDLLINNASLYPADTMRSCETDQLNKLLQLNTIAPLELTRQVNFKEGALVVNIGDARQLNAIKGHFSYGVSKNFLHTLTREQAREMAPAVRVNMLAFGQLAFSGAAQDFERARLATPLQRLATDKDVVNALFFLIGATAITGQTIYLDGGRHLGRKHD